jgi:hypothetical protein
VCNVPQIPQSVKVVEEVSERLSSEAGVHCMEVVGEREREIKVEKEG